MRVTIADVARRAGVSTATVSRVLNDKGLVDPETRARVGAAVKELNYTPNLSARHLGSGQSRMVGLVLPDIANPFFPMVAKGAADVARRQGYTLLFGNSDNEPDTETEAVRALIGRGVDGVIVAPVSNSAPWLGDLVQAKVPVVLLDRRVGGHPVDCVTGDNRSGGAQMARYLAELGHTRVGFIAGPSGVASADDRWAGFAEAAAELGLELRTQWHATGDFQLLSGFRAMNQILSAAERPTAVACANDLMALGALRALRLAGVAVPYQMAVVGYDDIPMAEMSDPALTTVAQPTYRLGAMAMERLLARLSGTQSGPPEMITLPVRVAVRESCGNGKRGQPAWL